ncbi:MAG: SEC-C domain-containing protein [Chitinispirillaceae bacterium]|nr:SEC-C domain-containing protein [Chitinispirillaceae bacterium]
MFDELRTAISREVSSYIFRLERVERTQRSVDTSQTLHGDFDIFAASDQERKAAPVPAGRPGGAFANRSDLVPHTIIKTGVEIGRNDPCPCGSGKKYKKCHGAL